MMKYSPILTSLEQAIADATPGECPLLLGELERLKGVAWGRIMAGHMPTLSAEQPDLLTMAEASKRLSIPESRAYELARQGKLPAVRIGKYVRVSAKALAEYQARLPKA